MNQIMRHHKFLQSKEADGLRRMFVDVLLKDKDQIDSLHIQPIIFRPIRASFSTSFWIRSGAPISKTNVSG
jgi:hypothetical protein